MPRTDLNEEEFLACARYGLMLAICPKREWRPSGGDPEPQSRLGPKGVRRDQHVSRALALGTHVDLQPLKERRRASQLSITDKNRHRLHPGSAIVRSST
jgi:hypothetical protein